ncbi:MAG: hypothetical protein PVI33_03345 [Candidatus Omnitrophota bacterium]
MIKVDFSIALALYFLILLGLVFCVWVLLRRRGLLGDFLTLNPRFTWCCSVCTYTYFTTHKTGISVCPRCGSYNKYSIDKEL